MAETSPNHWEEAIGQLPLLRPAARKQRGRGRIRSRTPGPGAS